MHAVRAVLVFAGVLVVPVLVFAVLRLIDTALGTGASARYNLPELIMGIGGTWKLLVYPHDVLTRGGTASVLPGNVAPVLATLQWALVASAIGWVTCRRSWSVQVAASLAAIVLVGIGFLIVVWSIGGRVAPFE